MSNTVILAGSTLAGIITARTLGPTGRGQLMLVMLWSGLIHAIGTLGLHTSASYHLASRTGDESALSAWVMRIALRQSAAQTVANLIVMWWLHVYRNVPVPLALEYATHAAAATLALYGAAHARGTGTFARFNIIRIISGAAPAVLMGAGGLALRLTPTEAAATYLFPIWCSAVMSVFWLRQAGRAPHRRALSSPELRAVWSYGWRSLTNMSGSLLNNSADQFVLGLIAPASSLGIYSVAASASSPLVVIVASLGMVGLPVITPLTGQAKAAATQKMLRRAAWPLILSVAPLAVALPWAIPWVYGVRYAAAVAPSEFLLAGAVFAALASVTDDLLRAHGLPGFVTITQGIGGAVTGFGTLLLGGQPLVAVALASAFGFMVAFTLAFARLWAATVRQDGRAGQGSALVRTGLVRKVPALRPRPGASDTAAAFPADPPDAAGSMRSR